MRRRGTFHFSEDLGLEASVLFTRFRTAVTDTYERRYPQVQIDERTDKPGRLYFGHLVWSFAYGKLRWFGGSAITRFDFNARSARGVTDDSTARGLTGSFGLGTKCTSEMVQPCASTSAITSCARRCSARTTS